MDGMQISNTQNSSKIDRSLFISLSKKLAYLQDELEKTRSTLLALKVTWLQLARIKVGY